MSRERRRIAIIIIGAAAVILLATALVLPNLHRSRIADGGAPGASTVRTLTTAEIMYASIYPDQGFASNLATLGPDCTEAINPDCRQPTAAHAFLIDAKVGCAAGGTSWCTSDLYRYNIQSSSSKPPYRDYWITATPITAAPDNKNYCSASDTILRSEQSLPLSRPYSLAECQALKIDSSYTYQPGASN